MNRQVINTSKAENMHLFVFIYLFTPFFGFLKWKSSLHGWLAGGTCPGPLSALGNSWQCESAAVQKVPGADRWIYSLPQYDLGLLNVHRSRLHLSSARVYTQHVKSLIWRSALLLVLFSHTLHQSNQPKRRVDNGRSNGDHYRRQLLWWASSSVWNHACVEWGR